MLKYSFSFTIGIMIKKGVVFVVIALLLVSFVLADPILVSNNNVPDEFMCSNHMYSSKKYRANATFIHVGLVCPDTAKLNLYELRESDIFTPFNFIASSYVVDGVYADFDNFEVDTRYYYECYTCKDPALNKLPIITAENVRVFEGEDVVLNAKCIDEEIDHVTFTYSGWMNEDTYTTSYEDQGMHSVELTCTDDFGGVSTKTVSVTVVDVNRPPEIVSIYNFG